jgi:hypothetical protein
MLVVRICCIFKYAYPFWIIYNYGTVFELNLQLWLVSKTGVQLTGQLAHTVRKFWFRRWKYSDILHTNEAEICHGVILLPFRLVYQ